MWIDTYSVEESVLVLAQIIRDKRKLEEENIQMEIRIRELEEKLDRCYNETLNQTASILNTLIERV